MSSVLQGIKVVDVAQVAAVPMCARHLADFGASVIHVEHPVAGDMWRAGVPSAVAPSGVNYSWENFNRNKRGMTLDLSQDAGRQALCDLIAASDVFVTNLRLWEQEKFRLGYKEMRRINPRLIYGSVTGFGKKGPDRNTPAYDTTAYWGRAGVSQVLTTLGMTAPSTQPAFGDVVAGLGLAFGVMTALYHRERTGVGQEVDISLFHTGIYQSSFSAAVAAAVGPAYDEWKQAGGVASGRFIEEDEAARQKRLDAVQRVQEAVIGLDEIYRDYSPNPMARAYLTSDGRRLIFNAINSNRYWPVFCRAIDRLDLIGDPRFDSAEARTENHLVLEPIFREAFLSKTLAEWRPLLNELPFAPDQSLAETVVDPQAMANNVFVPFDHPIHGSTRVINNPVNLSETPATIRTAAPEFSQHTEEIMLELGRSWEDIARLKKQGVIA